MLNWLYNKSTSSKVKILLSVLLVQVLVSLVSVYELAKVQTLTKMQGDHFFGTSQALDRMDKLSLAVSPAEASVLLFKNSSLATEKGIEGLMQEALDIANYCLDNLSGIERIAFSIVGFGSVVTTCETGASEAYEALNIVKELNGKTIGKKGSTSFNRVELHIKSVAQLSLKFASLMPEVASFVRSVVYILIPLLSIITATFLYIVMVDIRNNLTLLSNKMRQMRENNSLSDRVELKREITTDTKDELLLVCHDFNLMVEKFEIVIKNISHMSNTLFEATKPLYEASHKSKNKMAEQNVMADQIVSVIEGFVGAISEISKNTNATSTSANQGFEVAQQGRTTIENAMLSVQYLSGSSDEMTASISNLNSNSNDISSIIGVISAISEQTNLLALNAAIEAARAGEHGRGFAVVADEVRSLASKTQQSTVQIQSMITALKDGTENSVSLINSNGKLVIKLHNEMNDADEALSQIAETTENIKHMNTQIATATDEQQYVVEEIQSGVMRMKENSDETTDAVNDVFVSFEKISSVIIDMNNTVEKFN